MFVKEITILLVLCLSTGMYLFLNLQHEKDLNSEFQFVLKFPTAISTKSLKNICQDIIENAYNFKKIGMQVPTILGNSCSCR